MDPAALWAQYELLGAERWLNAEWKASIAHSIAVGLRGLLTRRRVTYG